MKTISQAGPPAEVVNLYESIEADLTRMEAAELGYAGEQLQMQSRQENTMKIEIVHCPT